VRDSYLQIIDEDIFQRYVMILVVSNGQRGSRLGVSSLRCLRMKELEIG
jgi:hypothetical protein